MKSYDGDPTHATLLVSPPALLPSSLPSYVVSSLCASRFDSTPPLQVLGWYYDEIQLGRCLHTLLGLSCVAVPGIVTLGLKPEDAKTGGNEKTSADHHAMLSQHPALRALLLATGDAPLVHVVHDAFWGSGKRGDGRNDLGSILGRVRAQLAA